MDNSLLQEINKKLDRILQILGEPTQERPKDLNLSEKELQRLYKSINEKATSLDDLTEEDQTLLQRYLSGVEGLGLNEAQREVLVDVLVASRKAVGKWPRLSKLRERLQSEVEARSYDANAAWLDDAHGWAGQD